MSFLEWLELSINIFGFTIFKLSNGEYVSCGITWSKYLIEDAISNLSSKERNEVMEQFRAGTLRILLSSDLLARGIDVQQLSLVINFDLPREKETYIHRIGRSGRYGRKGVAINLLGDNEVEYLKHIESYYDTKINEMPADITEFLN